MLTICRLKHPLTLLAICIGFIAATACNAPTETTASHPKQSEQAADKIGLKQLAQHLDIQYQHIANDQQQHCDQERAYKFCYKGQLVLSADTDIALNRWQLYFSHISAMQKIESELFTLTRINGDLHKIEPTPKFLGFKSGEPIIIPFYSDYWSISESDPMPNYYLVGQDDGPYIVDSTRTHIDPETGLETLPFVKSYEISDQHFKKHGDDKTTFVSLEQIFDNIGEPQEYSNKPNHHIIPQPQQLTFAEPAQTIDIAKGISLPANIFSAEQLAAIEENLLAFGIKLNKEGQTINIVVAGNGEAKQTEQSQAAYQLAINAQGIKIHAAHSHGAIYALYSLAGLADTSNSGQVLLPHASIDDTPRFAFRGMLIDIARNFHSLDMLKRLINQMGIHKLNTLHLHFTDDEAWRIEIEGLGELTEFGSKRCHDPDKNQCLLPQLGSGPFIDNAGNKALSVQDYIDLIRYADARAITILPSMDMPGHSRAAVRSMEVRYQRLMAAGKKAEAEAFLLSDFNDPTQYESVQYYHDNTINPCMESSYVFFTKVIDTLASYHERAGQPLKRYHVGADETPGAWTESEICRAFIADPSNGVSEIKQLGAYFLSRIASLLDQRNIDMAAWSDGMEHYRPAADLTIKTQSNAWTPLFWGGHKIAHEHANAGKQVVLSVPDALYFDFPYAADPKEPGYYWGSRATSTAKVFEFMPDNLPAHALTWTDRDGKPMILDDTESMLNSGASMHGMQGQLWSETSRTDNMTEHQIYPRIFALAERAWHQADWEIPYQSAGVIYEKDSVAFNKNKQLADWQRFSRILGHSVLPRLEQQQVFYRLPTAGAKIIDGQLHLRSPIPKLNLYYQLDDKGWQNYDAPVTVNSTRSIKVRTGTASGKRLGRIHSVN